MVREEPRQRALDERKPRGRPTQRAETVGELGAARPCVEVAGERGDRAPIQFKLSGRVASGREQEHRAPDGAVQLLLGQLDLGAGDQCDGDQALYIGSACEHLLDLLQDGPHHRNDTIRCMRDVLGDVERWRSRGERVAIATVVASRRSAPRPIGSKLAVSERGEMAGSISGGCVEGDVAERAKEVIAGADPVLLTYGIADEEAFEVGLPCGGEIDVWLERLE